MQIGGAFRNGQAQAMEGAKHSDDLPTTCAGTSEAAWVHVPVASRRRGSGPRRSPDPQVAEPMDERAAVGGSSPTREFFGACTTRVAGPAVCLAVNMLYMLASLV